MMTTVQRIHPRYGRTDREEGTPVTDLTLMTCAEDPASVLPALALLSHRVRVLPLDAASPVRMPEDTVLLIDADVIIQSASPAEVEARLRLVCQRETPTRKPDAQPEEAEDQVPTGQVRSGDLVVDTESYTARIHGRPINLAYKEFELLKYLVQHPGRVFTRAQLLQEVWGYDYYGGTRTVDVHVRRLRAKLGSEYEHLIGTVRNVGYRFDPPSSARTASAPKPEPDAGTDPDPAEQEDSQSEQSQDSKKKKTDHSD